MSNEMREPRNNASELFSKLMPVESKAQPGAQAYALHLMEKGKQRMQTVSINDDQETLERIAHTLLPGEKLGAWYARVGLGKNQIHLMSQSEIAVFVLSRPEDESPAPKSSGNRSRSRTSNVYSWYEQ